MTKQNIEKLIKSKLTYTLFTFMIVFCGLMTYSLGHYLYTEEQTILRGTLTFLVITVVSLMCFVLNILEKVTLKED